MMQFWNDVAQLRSLSNFLQWAAIALVFLGGLLQLARFTVDRHEKSVQATLQAHKEKAQERQEAEFHKKISGLEAHLSDRQKEIAELKSEATDLRSQTTELLTKAAELDPLRQTIKSGTATVEITIASPEAVNTHYMDKGGYLAFAKGQDALMVLNSLDCLAVQRGENRILYRAVFTLDATSDVIGNPIGMLKKSEYLQIGFKPMQPKQKVLSGRAVVTINNSVRFDFEVPAQQMAADFIIVRKIESQLASLK
jgi:hypothetical protein